MNRRKLLQRMSSAARERALSNSGEEIFDRMYETYARFHGNDGVRHESLDVAKVESGNGLCLLRLVVWRFRGEIPGATCNFKLSFLERWSRRQGCSLGNGDIMWGE